MNVVITVLSWMPTAYVVMRVLDLGPEKQVDAMQNVEGNVIGWRAFRVAPDWNGTTNLVSPIVGVHRFQLLGVNAIHPGRPPTARGSTTGFYVFRSKKACLHHFPTKRHQLVFATVLCHGYVAHHTRAGWFNRAPEGFRAEKLEILSLYSTRNSAGRDLLGQRLGWPEGIKHISTGPNKFPLKLKEKNDRDQ